MTIEFSVFEAVLVPSFILSNFDFFCTKFAQKAYFWSQAEKVNITIELSIFSLVQQPIFILVNFVVFFYQISPINAEKNFVYRKLPLVSKNFHEIHLLKEKLKSLVDDGQLPEYFNISSAVCPEIKISFGFCAVWVCIVLDFLCIYII